MDAVLDNELLDMDQVKIDPRWALMIPSNLALRKQVLPFTRSELGVLVACRDPNDTQSLQAVERYLSHPVIAQRAESASLERMIQRIFQDAPWRSSNPNTPFQVVLAASANQSDEFDPDAAVALTDEVFHAAIIRQATDIHIEPRAADVRIRLRVDGVLEDYRTVPAGLQNMFVSRIKVICGMDIAERRAPQDGRYSLALDRNQDIDVRAAAMPTKHGERLTLRLLANNRRPFSIDELGMAPNDLNAFVRCIHRPNGLVVITGPTGCGKSTTLYSAIRQLIRAKPLNVITIEDPVESVIDGISQIEVDSGDKVSFHKALRGVLRHDPDVLMIGEIRDEETAETAIKAALTGHLVLTTLHANSAASSITRLLDMKVKPFLVGAVTRVTAAQRLVRQLCVRCRIPVEMTLEQATILGRPELAGSAIFQPGGCKYCAGSGFLGRLGLFEFVFFDPSLSQLVAHQITESRLNEVLRQRQTRLLLDDGIDKLRAGETSFDQVAAVISPY